MKITEKKCSVCQTSFSCGGTCWCTELPPIFPMDGTIDCLCKSCLTEKTKQYLNGYVEELTSEKITKIQSLPKGKLVEGIDYTISPQGLYVFSKFYLVKRGTCCGNGCTNCPY